MESANELVSLQYESHCQDIAYWRCRSATTRVEFGMQTPVNSLHRPIMFVEHDGPYTDKSAMIVNAKDHVDQAAGLIPLMMIRTTV